MPTTFYFKPYEGHEIVLESVLGFDIIETIEEDENGYVGAVTQDHNGIIYTANAHIKKIKILGDELGLLIINGSAGDNTVNIELSNSATYWIETNGDGFNLRFFVPKELYFDWIARLNESMSSSNATYNIFINSPTISEIYKMIPIPTTYEWNIDDIQAAQGSTYISKTDDTLSYAFPGGAVNTPGNDLSGAVLYNESLGNVSLLRDIGDYIEFDFRIISGTNTYVMVGLMNQKPLYNMYPYAETSIKATTVSKFYYFSDISDSNISVGFNPFVNDWSTLRFEVVDKNNTGGTKVNITLNGDYTLSDGWLNDKAFQKWSRSYIILRTWNNKAKTFEVRNIKSLTKQLNPCGPVLIYQKGDTDSYTQETIDSYIQEAINDFKNNNGLI